MKPYILSILVVIQAYYEVTKAVQEYGVLRMDDNVYYLRYQNVVKAFTDSKPAWYYGYNYDKEAGIDAHEKLFGNSKDTCIYFTKDNVGETKVNFTRHYRKNSNQTFEHLYGTFFKTTIKNHESRNDQRNSSNAIIVSKEPGKEGDTGFKLLYSDYKDCSIWRPIKLPSGGLSAYTSYVSSLDGYYDAPDLSYRNQKAACVVLLSDEAARGLPTGNEQEVPDWMKPALNNEIIKQLPQQMPIFCRFLYRNLCGWKPDIKIVFNQSCPRINPLGC